MPRTSKNPTRHLPSLLSDELFSTITVTTVVHIPILEGYWAEALDILKLCLTSLRQSTTITFDLMVFDNASCPEVRAYLREAHENGTINYLIQSDRNVNKSGAWNFLFAAAPGDIIVFTDSDVLFFSGWLEASLAVLNTFPKAGMITAQPIRVKAPNHDITQTVLMARQDPNIDVDTGKLIPEKYLRSRNQGLGHTEKQYIEETSGNDICISQQVVRAYVSASHFQFVTRKQVVQELLPFNPSTRFDKQFEIKLTEAGYWALSTTGYYVHHLGNTLPGPENNYDGIDWIDLKTYLSELGQVDLSSTIPKTRSRPAAVDFLVKTFKLHSISRRLYALSYRFMEYTQ